MGRLDLPEIYRDEDYVDSNKEAKKKVERDEAVYMYWHALDANHPEDES